MIAWQSDLETTRKEIWAWMKEEEKNKRGKKGRRKSSASMERGVEGSKSAGTEHEFQRALYSTCAEGTPPKTLASACSIGELEPVGARSSRLS